MMMNKLKSFLDSVETFNQQAKDFRLAGDAITARREEIVTDGKALGLNLSEVRAMLASIKAKVVLPDAQETEPDEPEADFAEVE